MSSKGKLDPAVKNLSDEILLQKIAMGDRKAFELIYLKFQPRLINFCARQLNHDFSLAADMADEALIEVWKSAGSFSGKSQASTWIHSIARFRLIAYLRKSKEILMDDESIQYNLEDQALLPEEEMLIESRNDQIVDGLGKLSEKHREIIELVYFRELSINEIAEMLALSENTVKTRMFYARKHLKTILSKNGILKP